MKTITATTRGRGVNHQSIWYSWRHGGTRGVERVSSVVVFHGGHRYRLERDSRIVVSSSQPSREEHSIDGGDLSERGDVNSLWIGILASLGMLETGYLAGTSLIGHSVACPMSASCASVLGSSYAYLWDTVPLSLLGCLTYGSIVGMMCLKMSQGSSGHRKEDAPSSLSVQTDSMSTSLLDKSLLWSTTLLVSSSLYLGHLLTTVFYDSPCPWCMASIALSLSIGALVIKNTKTKQLEEHVMPGAGLMFSTVFLLSLGLGNASDASGGITSLEYKDPVVTTESSSRAIALAKRLKEDGAAMYGAFWCSHCYEQKQDFGYEAMKEFPYVECFPQGWSKGVSMATECTVPLGSAGTKLQGFPTWVIGGQVLEGEQSFDTLEDALNELEGRLAATH